MKIELATLKRIAKATPELTIAQFVAVWSEKVEDQARERDRERHRKEPENVRKEDGNAGNEPKTYEQQERELYAFAKTVCGSRAGGLVTDLLKQHGRDIGAVQAIFERAREANDPKAFVAGNIRKNGNGAGSGIMDTFDRLIAEAKTGPGSGDGPLLDLTPTRSGTG